MRWLPFSAALSFAALALPACSGGGAGAASARPDAGAAVPARPVQVASPSSAPWPRIVVLHGQLEAHETVQIAARVEGPLEYVGVDLGDEVRRGQTLARISAVDFRARTTQADAQLTQAQSNLSRIESLDRPGAVSEQDREIARTNVAVAESTRALARRELSDANVRAPFAGRIAQRDVARGDFVRVGTAMFTIVSAGPLRLALSVPERFAGKVTVGTKVTVVPENALDQRYDAEVVRIGPMIDPLTRTFRIEAEIDPHDGIFLPGMFVLGTIALGIDPESVRLPRGAVFSVLGHDRVATVVDGKIELVDVELLAEDHGDAIVHGLAPSAVVVTRGGGNLAPGTSVRAEAAPANPAAAAPGAHP